MDDFKVNFENSQRPANVQKPMYDDLSDLDPIKVSPSQVKYSAAKMPSDTVSFGPITAERLILAAACMMAVAMFLPWVTIGFSFLGFKETTVLVQIKDNLGESIFVILAAASALYAAIRYDKKKLYLAIIFFAGSAGMIIRKQINIKSNYKDLSDIINIKFEIGFYIYMAAAIFMVVAIILKLIDRN